MNDLKHKSKLLNKNKVIVLACLAIGLFGVAIFRIKFPALRNELSGTLLIATLVVMLIAVFKRRK